MAENTKVSRLKTSVVMTTSEYYNERYKSIIEECQVWCDYRLKLLVEKKLAYWFKLFRYRKYYLTTKK